MQDLTARQQQCLDFISTYIRDHGYPPSMREIGEEMGIVSPNGVLHKLRSLERKGWLVTTRGVSRGIRIVGACPCCGRESAGADL